MEEEKLSDFSDYVKAKAKEYKNLMVQAELRAMTKMKNEEIAQKTVKNQEKTKKYIKTKAIRCMECGYLILNDLDEAVKEKEED